jgi:hypothetical protein
MSLTAESTASIESLSPGQKVYTSFGPGVVSAVSYVDSIVYVSMTNNRSGLYILRPEQIEIVEPL